MSLAYTTSTALASGHHFKLKPYILALSLAALVTGYGQVAHAEDKQPESGSDKTRNERSADSLPEVNVKAGLQKTATTENSRSYTTPETQAATRLSLSLRETPQSVSVLTRQRIDDQNLLSVTEAVTNVTGISEQKYDSNRSSFSARGFAITNYLYDGIPTSFDTGYSAGENELDTAIYDRIEVVRGATGLLTGVGNPSASINLVRKRADSKEFTGSVSGGFGTWDNRRGVVDISTPLNQDGSVRARAVAGYQRQDSYIKNYELEKSFFYGIIDADIAPNTTLSLGAEYQDNDPKGSNWGGFPLWYADGSRTNFGRSTTAAANWSSWGSTTQTVFANLEHQFDNDWKLRARVAHNKNEIDARLLYLYGYPDKSTGLGVSASPAQYVGDRTQNSVDVYASGPFALFGREHELVVGFAGNEQKGQYYSKPALSVSAVGNFFAWDSSYAEPAWGSRVEAGSFTTKQVAVYTAARFSVTDDLKFIVGGRQTSWKTDAYDFSGNYNGFDHKKFIPYAGLVYNVSQNISLYGSYTDIFNPQNAQDKNGKYLDPTTGKSVEAGIKGEFLGGKLNTSFAVFEIKQDNVAQTDINNLIPGTIFQASYAANGTKSRGFEAEVSGELAPRWNAFAGVSHYTAKDGEHDDINTSQPRSLVKVFTTYRLPGELSKLTVGGGANWQSSNYTLAFGPNGEEKVSQSAYTLVNLLAKYDINTNWQAQLNVNNLLDKKFYSQIGFYSQGAYGAPRNAMLTLRYQF